VTELTITCNSLASPGRLGELAFARQAGVVDEDVDLAAQLAHLIKEGTGRGGLAQVGGEHVHPGAMLAAEFLCECLEAVFPAGHQDQVVALRGQEAGEAGADAGGGAGHQGTSSERGHGQLVG